MKPAALLLLLALLCGCATPPGSTNSAATPPDPILNASEPAATPEGFTWIPGGKFTMGKADGLPDAKLTHDVSLSGFWIGTTEITNAQFREFVEATGYTTTAEIAPNPDDFPGANPADLVPGALVHQENGWQYVNGASWRTPTGPNSDAEPSHPVVNINYHDALAYCEWVGGTLPTEAQFEFAARGGLSEQKYTWGNEMHPSGKQMANIWQGKFPVKNRNDDLFLQTAPVKSFPANGYGLFDMSGNVWEWCLDWYDPNFYDKSPPLNPVNDIRPSTPEPSRVTRGGSFLCSDNYCLGYQPGTRMKTTPDTALFHTGFRVVINP